MPIRSQLMIGAAVIAMAAGFGRMAPAETTRDAVTTVDCQDRFLLDRRDHPDSALRNFHQCTAIQNVSRTLDDFTFWYVTLPEKPHPAEDSWFARVWRDDIGILTSPSVGLSQQKATAILDDSIASGLRRGKRDDLVDKWRATHNPQIFLTAEKGPAQAKLASVNAPASGMLAPPKAAAPEKPVSAAPPATVVITPQASTAGPAKSSETASPPAKAEPARTAEVAPAPPKVEPPKTAEVAPVRPVTSPKRPYRRARERYERDRYRNLDLGVGATANQLNRAEPPGGWYAAPEPPNAPQAYYPVAATPPTYYAAPAPAYYPVSAPPAYPPSAPAAYAPPPAVRQAPPIAAAPVPSPEAPPPQRAVSASLQAEPPAPPVTTTPVVQPAISASLQPKPAAPAPVQPIPSAASASAASASAAQTYARPASAAPRVRTIPEQVEFNLRTIAGLINSNIQTIQGTIFGPQSLQPLPQSR